MLENSKNMELEKMQELDQFCGHWLTKGIMYVDEGNSLSINGSDIYEWLPGKFFLLHKVDVTIGTGQVWTTEIIGFDSKAENFFMHYYGSDGRYGNMSATFKHNRWTFSAGAMRFTGEFSADKQMISGIWEKSSAGIHWKRWMEITLTKQK